MFEGAEKMNTLNFPLFAHFAIIICQSTMIISIINSFTREIIIEFWLYAEGATLVTAYFTAEMLKICEKSHLGDAYTNGIATTKPSKY